ncbi:MAG: NAD(P)-binding protein [Lachnospiraceae bacterium]|nr:NAD(P)-binding protein [Lachnospiraceae bacterium]
MKYLIIGAGPAGLTLANKLMQQGEQDFLVLERESEAGGLCRSKDIDGSPLDIGGGHFLDVRNPRVLDFAFDFMPESEWDRYVRDSRIVVNDNMIGSPIEANIWQMKLEDQVQYLKAIAVAGCNLGIEMPEKFVDWIYWKLGKKIADDYMIPYNQKMFGENLNDLGTYWLNKLPNVSFDETLISCLEKKAYGTQPGHAEFFYPKKYGYGELWLRMAKKLENRIVYNEKAITLDLDTRTVNGKYKADIIINTSPWTAFNEITGLTDELKEKIKSLKHSSVVINYVPETLETEAQWIYYPDPELDYHRILVRSNFCPNSKGYWTETNLTRFKESGKDKDSYFIMDYAYPLNTIGKQEKMQDLLKYTESKGVYGLGRWGEWQHYNSDVVVNLALEFAEKI